jgi:hypothetical protein
MTDRPPELYWRSEPHRPPVAPLSLEQLEAGLLLLDRIETDHRRFWFEHEGAFQATVRLAIRETAEALMLQQMPLELRRELERQLKWLTTYLRQEELRAGGPAPRRSRVARPCASPS